MVFALLMITNRYLRVTLHAVDGPIYCVRGPKSIWIALLQAESLLEWFFYSKKTWSHMVRAQWPLHKVVESPDAMGTHRHAVTTTAMASTSRCQTNKLSRLLNLPVTLREAPTATHSHILWVIFATFSFSQEDHSDGHLAERLANLNLWPLKLRRFMGFGSC